MEERKALRCPLCGAAMTEGDVVCKIGAGPTLYPRVPGESEGKHLRKMFFGSRDAISAPETGGGPLIIPALPAKRKHFFLPFSAIRAPLFRFLEAYLTVSCNTSYSFRKPASPRRKFPVAIGGRLCYTSLTLGAGPRHLIVMEQDGNCHGKSLRKVCAAGRHRRHRRL